MGVGRGAVRWRSVIPFSIVILTFIVARNLFVYVANLPSNEYDLSVDDSKQIANVYRRQQQQLVNDRDENSRPEAHNKPLKQNGNGVSKTGNGSKRKRAGMDVAFKLFPDDEVHADQIADREPEVKNEESWEIRNQQRRRQSDGDDVGEREDDVRKIEDKGDNGYENDENHRRPENDDYTRNDNDDMSKNNKRIASANDDEKKEGKSSKFVADLDTEHELAAALNSLKPRNDSRRSNLSSLSKDALEMMANMGEVGAIVRKMKQSKRVYGGRRDDNDASTEDKRQRHPVKPHPFKSIINSLKVCGSDAVFVIAYVHTAPDHYKRRMVIRQTWGDVSQYDVTIKIVFVMGVVLGGDTATENALLFEAEQYGDIVQEDFIDSYHNLTHKGVAALRWIDVHCQQATFVLKTDDDIFVNMFTLIKYLKRTFAHSAFRPRGLLMCLVWDSMPVLREGKWKVTKEEYPDDMYPTYCSGSAFIMSTDVAVSMHRVSYDVPFFWVDDFYITGLLPLKLGNVTHRQFASAYVLNGDRLEDLFTGPQWYTYVFSHVHNLDRIQSVWKTLTLLANGKIIPTIQTRLAVDTRHRKPLVVL